MNAADGASSAGAANESIAVINAATAIAEANRQPFEKGFIKKLRVGFNTEFSLADWLADTIPEPSRFVAAISSTSELPHVDVAGHVGGGEARAVGRERNGMEPILELAAARFAQFFHQLSVGDIPEAHDGVAPR